MIFNKKTLKKMQKEQLSLADMKNVLSRAEMKNIIGGHVYQYTDDNMTTNGTPGVSCYVTCTMYTDGVAGTGPCATYAIC
jgi:hypothetical protein